MKPATSTPKSRWAKRSVHQQLLYKFINEYGYQQGPVVARAIVSDILALVDELFSERLPPRYLVWPAVPIHNGATGKSPDVKQLVTVKLQMVTDEEVALLNDQHLLGQRLARRTFNQHRFARWANDAHHQGGVLTLFDLSLLSGLSEAQVSHLVRLYQEEHNLALPLRGVVHDTGRAVSHKSEVVRRYLRGQSPADIAYDLKHSQQAVDRYLKDYEVVRKLVQIVPIDEIPMLARCSKSLVQQYLKLIRQFEPDLSFFAKNT